MNEKMKEKQSARLKELLMLYIQWPVIMLILLLGMNLWMYFADIKLGIIMSVFVLVYIVMTVLMYGHSKAMILRDLVGFASQYGVMQNVLLKEMSTPHAILTEDGQVLWMNDRFEEILSEKVDGKEELYISKYMPELNRSIFPKEEGFSVEMDVYYGKKEFRAEIRKVSVEGLTETEQVLGLPDEKDSFIAVYLEDVTELNAYIQAYEEQRMVAGLIYIDNYDEVIESVEEVRQSLLIALVDRKINQYISKMNGIVKKMENDKYFIALQKRYFKELENDRFSLLEDVKSVNIGNTMPVTISVGLGLSKESYAQSYSYARVAIDLALARGGDQAVIKDGSGITYYGGKRDHTSKNTRVKARVKAEALREFITVKDVVFVMGHQMTDVDSFGAAVGVYRAAAALGKKAHIIVNEVSASLRPLYNAYVDDEDYPEDMLLTSEEALELADEKSMVVVVDTSRPQMTECPELLKLSKTIVVLDHHRQNSDNIDNALLSYIEPYASSACEMVSEILQYIVDDIKIPKLEASSLYAGIMIDTNYFVNKTGVRTFEAAAFLRRHGADLNLVRKMFRDDMDAYRAKAEIISSAEVYREEYAIAKGEDLHVESPTIVGAQAANDLLDINEIKASFVFTVYNDRIYVSARSIDEVNVQVIMERLGGGGHMNASGAQFDHTDMELAIKTLKEEIDRMEKEGDL